MARAILVTDAAALADAVDQLRHARRLAIDTESNSMHAFRTRLCAVQLCAASDDAPADDVFVIDTLAVEDVRPLAALLGRDGPTKIVHDVAFDARLLGLSGLPFEGVIDTALHARYLGLKETGLGSLVAARHGVQLSKALQQDDWARRPLTPEQLEYLAADVAYLGPLAASLVAEATARDIAEEVVVETEYALAGARAEETGIPGYVRLKGARELSPAARAALREMAAVRDTAAAKWDMPVGRVVSNQGLVAAARSRASSVYEIKRAAGLHDRGAAIAGELLAALSRGMLAGDVPEAERAYFVRERLGAEEIQLRRDREAALSAWRRAESTERGVDLQVVLPGHVLSDIVARAPTTLEAVAEIPGIGARRAARYGPRVLELLAEAARPKPQPA